jgi:hypothetical protein
MKWVYMALGALASASIVAGLSIGLGYKWGKQAVYTQIRSQEIRVYKDGRQIDDEVLSAEDDSLCDLLGGCGLPNEGGNH